MGNRNSTCRDFCNSKCCCCFRAFNKKWRPGEEDPDGAPYPKPPSPEDPLDSSSDVLKVRDLDFLISQNGGFHHTDKFELMNRVKNPHLVVRRGQPFLLNITFNRKYDPDKDAISFIFTVADADKPNYGQGTLTAVPLLNESNTTYDNQWNAIVKLINGNSLTVEINTTPTSVVAEWKIDIDTKIKGDGAYSYSHPRSFYLLFNPWCVDDEVYLEGEDYREEYVLQDTGLIWRGSHNRQRPSIWKYAQYEKDILECSIYLISTIGKLKGLARSDPVKTSRAASAAVNSPDDYGAIMGNWSDDFGSETPPTKWVGSMEILQKYYKSKKPVKYGQCWTFAGVLTTICRAIGIPSRVITAYSAAHDTHGSLTVDYFIDEDGKIMEEMSSDSIWNYHCWNEVWMNRPDLGDEYSGWQVIDGTPQELSDDMFRCGPASVLAIKKGEITKAYDNTFVYAEVNADKVYWKYTGPTQPLKLLRKDVHSIGVDISTKAVGKWEREDLTLKYKYPESSIEERVTMLNALQMSSNLFSRYYLNEDFNDVQFDFELRDDIKIGQPFNVVLLVKNHSETKDHRVHGRLKVETVLYTGTVGEPVKVYEFNQIVKPTATDEIKLHVSFEEYYHRLVDQCAFNISCLAVIEETKFEYFAQDDFRVRKPDIKISISGKPKTGQEFVATLKLENPLPIPLRKGVFMVEGVGLDKKLIIKLKENVPPNDYATATIKLTPPWSGRHTIAAKFTSKEMDDVDGFLAFLVEQRTENNGTT